MEHKGGWWTFTFSLFPDEQEVLRFQSGKPFTRTDHQGLEFKSCLQLEGNVFSYTARFFLI